LWRSSSPATKIHLTVDPKGAEAVTIKRRLVKLERANPPIKVRSAVVVTGARGEVVAIHRPGGREVGEKAKQLLASLPPSATLIYLPDNGRERLP
jgi:hypothetical protein